MRTFGASLVLNAVLGGAEFYLLNEDDGDLSTLAPVVICTVHTEPAAAEGSTNGSVSAAKADESFDWLHVDSSGYLQYVANLRNSGYSEKAIHETITADVSELFRTRARGQLVSSK